MSTGSLTDAINALAPRGGGTVSRSEVRRILENYENQVNSQLHNMTESQASEAETSVSKSINLRNRLPDPVRRPSKDFNDITYVVGEMWAELETTETSLNIQKAAYSEAVGVAVDKVQSAVLDIGNSFENVGNIVLTLTKYAPYFIFAVVGYVLYKKYKAVAK